MKFVLSDGVLRRIKKEENIEDFEGNIFEIDDTEVITIPDGTKDIQINANLRFTFEKFSCKNTRKVILPAGLENIGESSFYGWEKLESINLPESLKEIQEFAFYGTAIKKLTIPESVEIIHSYAFGFCPELDEFVFPHSSTETHADMLNGCKKLKSIDIPSYMKTMLQLSKCGFESIIVPEGIESIYPGAFEACDNLSDVEFPSTLQRQEIYAFDDCNSLHTITFKKYLKPFTVSLDTLPSLKRLNVPFKDAAKAKVDFPKLIIGDLDGNIIYAEEDNVSEQDKPHERKKPEKKQEDPMDDSKLHNRSIDIEQNGIIFHVDIKGTGAITKTVNKYLKAANEKGGTEVYDPKELVQLNVGNLFENEKTTGVRIHTLGQDSSACQIPGRYSAPISADEVITRANAFQSKALICLSNEKIKQILNCIPHKKNGTLHKKRTTCILKLNCVDADAMMCMIYAKNLDDTVVEINVKHFYVGDDISQGNELAASIL